MNNLSQFIFKKREEFDEKTNMPEKYEDVEKSLYDGEKYPESPYELSLTKLEDFLTQSHIELLEEVKRDVEELRELCITDGRKIVCNCHHSMKDLSIKLSETIIKELNEVKKV